MITQWLISYLVLRILDGLMLTMSRRVHCAKGGGCMETCLCLFFTVMLKVSLQQDSRMTSANHNPFQKDKCISHYVNFNVFLSLPSPKVAVWHTFELSSGRGLITVWLVSRAYSLSNTGQIITENCV